MPNVGPTELLLIVLVALLVFGAGRVADIGKGLGQGIKNFKQGLKEAGDIDGKDKDAKKADKSDKKEDAPKDTKSEDKVEPKAKEA